jgi:hypothetical protein
MGRSTFEGPVLSGDNRFGPFRNVGSMAMTQSAALNITTTQASPVTSPVNTAGYSGASQVFVKSNGIPNANAVIYTPSSTNPVLVASTPPADAATVYRGYVAYLPAGSRINNFFVDINAITTFTSGTLTSIQVNVSNDYVAAAGTCTYAQTAVLTSPAAGRQNFNAFTATQLANQQATSTDLVGINNTQSLSQIVFTIASINSTNVAITGGIFYFTIVYSQPDGNIGTTTAYPYGNFD